jgi:hypothetical protein
MGEAQFRISRAFVFLLAVMVMAALIPVAGRVAAAEEVASFRISQTVAAPPNLIAYLEILSPGNTLVPVKQEQLSAALGSSPLDILKLNRFQDQADGVAYILLVDISKSLKEKEFAQMRQMLADLIDMMGPKDRAGIVTFGQEVRQELNFTADKNALKAVINQLKPADMNTQLHRGLIGALEMGRRTDPDLPARRAIITLSDGQDDFAGGATKQEVLNHFKTDPVPIYAIGFYPPPKKPSKEEALKTLGEFARSSGGSYFRAEAGAFGVVYEQIWQRINDVYVATLAYKKGPWDGAVHYLQMDLATGPQALRAGMDIRLPSWTPAAAGTGSKTWWNFLPDWKIWGKVMPGWVYGSAILALLAIGVALGLLMYQRRRASEDSPAYINPQWGGADSPGEPMMVDNVNFPRSPETAAATVALAGGAAGPQKSPAAKGVKVRLSFIRSEASVPPLEFTITRPLVVGRSKPPSDLVIPEDKEVSRKHFQLMVADGAVKIVDLGSQNGTLVNGVPINGQFRLTHDDIIRVGKTELRVAII